MQAVRCVGIRQKPLISVVIKPNKQEEFFNISLEEWFGINLSNPKYFVCNPNDWPTLFGAICRHLWIRRNNSVFNADFIVGISILEKSNRMRDEHFHLNKDLASSIGQRQTKACKLIRWNPTEDEWHKVKTDGAVCTVSGNASTGGVIRDNHGKWTSGFSKYISCRSALNAELWVWGM
ncbi:hypothetical protein J1N35_015999 [Gossypium stocksii]|uniref:RNase H type-1 domain-containing protein n=1 Tax=Gossypium stocksii TaxID=47602 RepID=A0A9D4A936_9ROSI|nr:hypothetical protein J1N35_015999 [Gossypium stocksii]